MVLLGLTRYHTQISLLRAQYAAWNKDSKVAAIIIKGAGGKVKITNEWEAHIFSDIEGSTPEPGILFQKRLSLLPLIRQINCHDIAACLCTMIIAC